MAGSITYRVLPYDEWERLRPICERNKAPFPNKEWAQAAVAERDGEIVGALFHQTVVHREPLILEDPYANFLTLQKTLEDAVPLDSGPVKVYAWTNAERTGKMVALAGFTKIGEFWEKEIRHGIPEPE